MDNKKILEKVQMKIAISKIKKEDIVMENKVKNILKAAVTAIITLILGTGVVYAGTIVYEKIWKTPEKINLSIEITEETKKENITEEEAKEIAINKLNQIGFNSNIVKTDHYKEMDSDKIMYCFITEDNYVISIDGKTGLFRSMANDNRDIQDLSKYMTKEEATQIANKYYKLFGFKDGEYEIVKAYTVNDGPDENSGSRLNVIYNKKYGDIYNPYEYISITLEAKIMDMVFFDVSNVPFDNNEVVLTKTDAIKIAQEEDKNIVDYDAIDTKAELMVVRMNADAYDRKIDKAKHYAPLQTPDYPTEERNYYSVEQKVRRAWVVVISYDTTDWDVVKRYSEGQYSYFIDATTGEIIGGATLDYTYSSSR